jgi:hypothetical protein
MRQWHRYWRSGEVLVDIFDIDYDTYIAEVSTPQGSRVEGGALDPDHPADRTLRGLQEAAEVLIDLAGEPDGPDGMPAEDINIQKYARFCPRGWPIVKKGSNL